MCALTQRSACFLRTATAGTSTSACFVHSVTQTQLHTLVQQVKWFSLIVNRSYNGWHRDAFSLKTWALRWAEIILTKYSPTMWTILLVAFSICFMQIVILTQSTRQTWLTNFSREFDALFLWLSFTFDFISLGCYLCRKSYFESCTL